MTQREAADIAGVTSRSWSNWEVAGNAPQIQQYTDICKAINCTMDELQDAIREIERRILSRLRGAA
jgi:DNA-binding XRE family transcriptional regulator